MWKIFTFVLFACATGILLSDSVLACGGGGGCGMSGGGYRGGRAVASRKVLTGGPALAKSANTAAGRYARSPAPRKPAVAAKPAPASARTVAVKTKAAAKPIYTCPMHPQIQWTGPVDCPLCGMKLRLKKANGVKPAAPDETAEGEMPAEGHADHAGMDGMEGTQGMGAMRGMDDMMMCCPGCMGGMSPMGSGAASPKASGKARPIRGGSMQGMAGMGCGC